MKLNYIYVVLLIFTMNFLNLIICDEEDEDNSTESIIIGGSEAHVGDFPAIVSLQHPYHYCAGTMITNSIILTAAHCLKGNSVPNIKESNVVACDISSVYWDSSESRQTRSVVQACTHPRFIPNTPHYDIAILKVDKPFVTTNKCYPMTHATKSSKAGTKCFIAGWGELSGRKMPDKLEYARIKIQKPTVCEDPVTGYEEFRKSVMICAGDPHEYDTCRGDSGGPLICNQKLEGVTSYGRDKCGEANAVYTRIPAFQDWIGEFLSTEECDNYNVSGLRSTGKILNGNFILIIFLFLSFYFIF